MKAHPERDVVRARRDGAPRVTLTSDATRNGITLRKSQNWPVVLACTPYYVCVRRLPLVHPSTAPFEIRSTFNPGVPDTLESLERCIDRRELARCAQRDEPLGYYLELREFYLPSRLVSYTVFSNRDFTSTLYSGMRASCTTSADLSRPLPHYLVHAPMGFDDPRCNAVP